MQELKKGQKNFHITDDRLTSFRCTNEMAVLFVVICLEQRHKSSEKRWLGREGTPFDLFVKFNAKKFELSL